MAYRRRSPSRLALFFLLIMAHQAMPTAHALPAAMVGGPPAPVGVPGSGTLRTAAASIIDVGNDPGTTRRGVTVRTNQSAPSMP